MSPVRPRRRESSLAKTGIALRTSLTRAGLARVADTLSAEPAIGRLKQVCERWIYTCLSLALDSEEQAASDFRYQYSIYQGEYSYNLLFRVGGQMEQVFQGLMGRPPSWSHLYLPVTLFEFRAYP